MRTLSTICIVLAFIGIIVACVSRLLVKPVAIPGTIPIESQAIGQLCVILLLFAIALNTIKQ